MSAESEIEIVGAGPAGLAAAITAARGGARVVVHEKAARVGSRNGAQAKPPESRGMTGRLAAVRRAFRAHALDNLRAACGTHDEYRAEAREIFGIEVE